MGNSRRPFAKTYRKTDLTIYDKATVLGYSGPVERLDPHQQANYDHSNLTHKRWPYIAVLIGTRVGVTVSRTTERIRWGKHQNVSQARTSKLVRLSQAKFDQLRLNLKNQVPVITRTQNMIIPGTLGHAGIGNWCTIGMVRIKFGKPRGLCVCACVCTACTNAAQALSLIERSEQYK